MPRGGPINNQKALKHGYYPLRDALNGGTLDKRSGLHRALIEKENELTTALGGVDNVSPQERVLIQDTVKNLMFLASLDHYLLQLRSLVRKGRVHAVVGERTRIAAHIRENLRALGLKRVVRTLTLAEILAEQQQQQGNGKDSNQNVR